MLTFFSLSLPVVLVLASVKSKTMNKSSIIKTKILPGKSTLQNLQSGVAYSDLGEYPSKYHNPSSDSSTVSNDTREDICGRGEKTVLAGIFPRTSSIDASKIIVKETPCYSKFREDFLYRVQRAINEAKCLEEISSYTLSMLFHTVLFIFSP